MNLPATSTTRIPTMDTPRRRGPPPGQTTTPLPQKAETVEIHLHDDLGALPIPPTEGIRCPSCGRGTPTRRTGTSGGKVYATCTLCGTALVLTCEGAKVVTVRIVGR